jgi:hypothetical protein
MRLALEPPTQQRQLMRHHSCNLVDCSVTDEGRRRRWNDSSSRLFLCGQLEGPMLERDRWGDPKFEEAVRETAYFLWEQDGRPQGREQEYWYRALERTLRERNADGAIRQQPRHTGQADDNQDDLGRDINSGH